MKSRRTPRQRVTLCGLAIAATAALSVPLGAPEVAQASTTGSTVSVWQTQPSTSTWLAQQSPVN